MLRLKSMFSASVMLHDNPSYYNSEKSHVIIVRDTANVDEIHFYGNKLITKTNKVLESEVVLTTRNASMSYSNNISE